LTGQYGLPRGVAQGVGFGATANFLTQFGPVQQVIKVARVAIWNLQWQTKGLVDALPGIDARTLQGRFVDGSDVTRIDLRKTVVNAAWESLGQQTSRLLLTNIIALYEGWCHELAETFADHGFINSSTQRAIQDRLQWPDSYAGRTRPGIISAINALESAGGKSPGMEALLRSVQPSPVATSRFAARLCVYRVFKEARNSIAHQGAIASESIGQAHQACSDVKPQDLGMRVVPALSEPLMGTPVSLSWDGVIGLADMLRRLVVDVDHCLMFTNAALLDVASRLRRDPLALADPTEAGKLIKRREWAKVPDGPFIVIGSKQLLPKGQKVVNHAISRLLSLSTSQEDRVRSIWPELVSAGAVEERKNLRGL
jgi:hypothetical protein